MAYLEIEIDGQHVTSHELQETTELGRANDCSLSFPVAFLSRRHLKLQQTAQGWRAIDLGSTNGTWVGGFKVSDHLLADGEVIQLGNLTLAFHERALASVVQGSVPQAAPPAGEWDIFQEDVNDNSGVRLPAFSIDEDASEPVAANAEPVTETPALTRKIVAWPKRNEATNAPVEGLWEVAMKPATSVPPKTGDSREAVGNAKKKAGRRSAASGSLSSWNQLQNRFGTDKKLKTGVILTVVLALGIGSTLIVRLSGIGGPSAPRLAPFVPDSHAQGPVGANSLPRDLPV
jgi:hypothetical protein